MHFLQLSTGGNSSNSHLFANAILPHSFSHIYFFFFLITFSYLCFGTFKEQCPLFNSSYFIYIYKMQCLEMNNNAFGTTCFLPMALYLYKCHLYREVYMEHGKNGWSYLWVNGCGQDWGCGQVGLQLLGRWAKLYLLLWWSLIMTLMREQRVTGNEKDWFGS